MNCLGQVKDKRKENSIVEYYSKNYFRLKQKLKGTDDMEIKDIRNLFRLKRNQSN